jgi:uncharacterized protein YggT (Ycf19 family)
MSRMLHTLLQLDILHHLVTVIAAVLAICFLIQMILSWVLQGRENKLSRFFHNITGPIWEPLDRIIPRVSIGGMPISIGFLVGWWSIGAVALLVSQALPPGW